jgi:hypothetical protein
MEKEIETYLNVIKNNYKDWISRSSHLNIEEVSTACQEFESRISVQLGSKYAKIVSTGSVHSFVVLNDDSKFKKGDILKAASWASPAKNFARGNVVEGKFGSIKWTGA